MSNAIPNNVVNIDLSALRKKRFCIKFDESEEGRILELNTSDMNVLERLTEAEPKLEACVEKALSLGDDEKEAETIEDVKPMVEILKEVDAEMRERMDYIFDANVSEVTAPDGSMYDLFNGSFRFEHIMVALLPQYEQNMDNEIKAMQKKFEKHTTKYTKGKK